MVDIDILNWKKSRLQESMTVEQVDNVEERSPCSTPNVTVLLFVSHTVNGGKYKNTRFAIVYYIIFPYLTSRLSLYQHSQRNVHTLATVDYLTN